VKKLILIIAISLMSAVAANATVFLVTAPQANVTKYSVQNIGALSSNAIIAQADGSLKLDVTTIATGSYTAAIQACDSWGDCSPATNFTFVRPVVPTAPTGPSLLFQ
jgi:hypothetical protein